MRTGYYTVTTNHYGSHWNLSPLGRAFSLSKGLLHIEFIVWHILSAHFVFIEKSRIIIVQLLMDMRQYGLTKPSRLVCYLIFLEITIYYADFFFTHQTYHTLLAWWNR